MADIKRSNPQGFQKLNLKLKQLEGYTEKVGWFETAKYEDGTPVAYVAAINELGSPANSIPARPMLRPTAIESAPEWGRTAQAGSSAILKGTATIANVMDAIGLQAESDVAKKIASITSPPLSPITIELRAMKKRDPSLKITGATVGQAAARVRAPGYVPPSGISTKPLNDTGVLISTLTHITEKE